MSFKKTLIALMVSTVVTSSPALFAKSGHDTDINSDVKNAIQQDQALSNVKVDITTKSGVVTLKGQVESDTIANELVQDAQSVAGVRDVNTDGLTVKDSNQPMTDSYITAKVKGAFLREKLFGEKPIEPMSISVETNNGVVYLSGEVDNKKIISNAVRIAKAVKGVKSVESKLTVNGNTSTEHTTH